MRPAPHRPIRPLHLAAAIDDREQYAAGCHLESAQLAEGGALDLVTLGGRERAGSSARSRCSPGSPGGHRCSPGSCRPSTGSVFCRALAVEPGEPADLALAVAPLRWVSQGRAGWTATWGEPEWEAAGSEAGPRPAAVGGACR